MTTSLLPELPVMSTAPVSKMAGDIRAGDYPVVPEVLARLVAAEDALLALDLTPTATFTGLLAEVNAAVLAGEAPPADLAARAADAVAAEERARIGELARQGVLERLRRQWPREAREHADGILDGLRDRLNEILAEVAAAVSQLGGLDPSDPEAVAEADAVQREAVAALKALRPRYRRVRALQCQLHESIADRPKLSDSSYEGEVVSWQRVWATRLHEFPAPPHGAPGTRDVLWWKPLVSAEVWLPTRAQLNDLTAKNRLRLINPEE